MRKVALLARIVEKEGESFQKTKSKTQCRDNAVMCDSKYLALLYRVKLYFWYGHKSKQKQPYLCQVLALAW